MEANVDAFEFARRVAATFQVEPRRHGREYRVPCPVHEAEGHHNPSLAIWDRTMRPAFKCMTGCSTTAVRAALRARGVSVPGGGRLTPAQQHAKAVANEQRRVEALRKSRELMMFSHPIAAGGPVHKYLTSRHLYVYDHLGHLLETRDPITLLGVITDLSTLCGENLCDKNVPRIVGTQTLALNEDGTPVLVGGKKLRSISGQMKGCGVCFGKPGPHLLVAEGIESMIAGMTLLGIPFGCAVLSASNMPHLAVPEWVERITVAADNDGAGISAANGLSHEMYQVWGSGGPNCFVVKTWGASGSGWDAADELMKRRST